MPQQLPESDTDELGTLRVVVARCWAELAKPGAVTRAELRGALTDPVVTKVSTDVTAPAEFGDGADRSVDLQAWIDAQPAGAVLNLGGLRIRCDRTITLTGRSGLTLRNGTIYTDNPTGDESTLAEPSKSARNRTHLRLLGCDRVALDGLTIRGAHPNGGWDGDYVGALEAQHGIEIQHSRHITVTGVTVTDVYGDLLYLGPDYLAERWTEDVTVDGFTGARCGRQGIAITGARRVTMRNLDVGDIRRTLLDIEPNKHGGGCEDLLIEDSRFGRYRLGGLQSTSVAPSHRVTIRRCDFWAIQAYVLTDAGRCTDWLIEDCTGRNAVGGPAGRAMQFSRVDGLAVRNCTQPLDANRNMALVQATDCTDVNVSGNAFPGGVAELREA